MSPHPATCVPHACLLLSPPLSLQLRLPRSACPVSVKESGAVRRFFHGVSIVNDVCFSFCLSLCRIVVAIRNEECGQRSREHNSRTGARSAGGRQGWWHRGGPH